MRISIIGAPLSATRQLRQIPKLAKRTIMAESHPDSGFYSISWDEVNGLAKRCTGFSFFKSNATVVEEAGMKFVVRIAESVAHKPHNIANSSNENPAAFADPFENPHTKDLFLKQISETHSIMMNKFNVVNNHLLVVTNAWETQTDPMNSRDFDALWVLVKNLGGLGFYNCGVRSGASQPHKHMQFIPLPLLTEVERPPFQRFLERAAAAASSFAPDCPIVSCPELPFVHWGAVFSDDTGKIDGIFLESVYKRLLIKMEAFQRGATPSDPSLHYNFVMTSKFMMVAPRSTDQINGVYVNSLGFAGSLFVKTPEQFEAIKQLGGPLSVLRAVGYDVTQFSALLASL